MKGLSSPILTGAEGSLIASRPVVAQAAIVHHSSYTGESVSYSYRQLLGRVKNFAGALKAQGVGKGDRVIIYMPMVIVMPARANFSGGACVRARFDCSRMRVCSCGPDFCPDFCPVRMLAAKADPSLFPRA